MAGDVAGRRFPGGEYLLPAHEGWLWTDAVQGRPSLEGPLTPGIAYMVGLHGGGAGIQDIMDLLGVAADAGVMMAGVELEVHRPMLPGERYAVTGEVTSCVRKQGRKAGSFDLVHFVHRLADAAGEPVADVHHSWVIPRGEDGA